jgi:hypothetical protein
MQVQITSNASFDVATFGHFTATTESNYSKLLQISRIISLIDDGADDEQFCVAEYSSQLYSTKYDAPIDPRSLVILASKGVSADEFWDYIRRLKRPTVFFRANANIDWNSSRVKPLYSPTDEEVLKIISASIESPIQIIKQLFYGRDDERRTQQLHELELEAKRLENVEKRARVAHEMLVLAEQVRESKITTPYKKKILSIVDGVSDRQHDLNKRLDANIAFDPKPQATANKRLTKRD